MAPRTNERCPSGGDTIATIEIRIRSLMQLFDALDPAPLQERALDRSAESYILTCAGRHRPTEPLRLTVRFPESLRAHAADATDAIHEHFRRTHAQGERNFRRRMRIGGFGFTAASGVLAASFGLRSLLSNVEAHRIRLTSGRSARSPSTSTGPCRWASPKLVSVSSPIEPSRTLAFFAVTSPRDHTFFAAAVPRQP